jgi:prepilin-type N-terminal cleavage/methylation domain-containing protein/prepilin-type processing-associated H-X9-DG protein
MPHAYHRIAHSRAFTLIELLVVIAIIALLVSILLPSLHAAKDLARTAACLAHVRGAGRGAQLYTTDHTGYLPGPNTSGAHIRNVSDIRTSSTEPTSNMDWVSPTLGQTLALPEDRKERIKAIFNTKLHCPANDRYFDAEYNGGYSTVNDLRYTSYAAMLGFHVTPDSKFTETDSIFASRVPRQPKGYNYRINQLGSPSQKVYAMDGARYVNYSSGQVSYNSFPWQDDGGNFMSYGPAFAHVKSNGSPYQQSGDEPHELAKEFAYRHQDKINAAYFDGHAETLDNKASRNVNLYFPAGSEIINASASLDPDDVKGQTIK